MRKNRWTVVIVALAFVASCLALAGCGSETSVSRENWNVVPNVIGMDVVSAQRLIERRGFRWARRTDVLYDTVWAQFSTPPVGKKAKPGTVITFGPRNGAYLGLMSNWFTTYHG
jgi:beta-lactam-binding protein with PASTA domain